jgi:hypothetical protein
MVPRAMTTIVQEGIEPMLIGTHLLQRIQYKAGMKCRARPRRPHSANLRQQRCRRTKLRCSRPAERLRPKIAKRFVDELSYSLD